MSASSPRVAIISDIHGNIDALAEVLKDIQKAQVKHIICLGDIVGYGGAPADCVRAVRSHCQEVVMGNHEAMTVFEDISYLKTMPRQIMRPIELARKVVNTRDLNWMRNLPLTAEINGIAVTHASLYRPSSFPYVFSMADARRHFDAQTTSVSFHGHSHVPVVWEENEDEISVYKPTASKARLPKENRYSINVGSVGQPRDGDPRASYVIYDVEKRDVTFCRVPYDIDSARQRIMLTSISEQNAERLKTGV